MESTTKRIAGTYGCKSCPATNMTAAQAFAHDEAEHPETIERRTADTPEQQARLAAGLADMAALRQQFASIQRPRSTR